MDRTLEAELTAHLGYDRHDPAGRGSGNSRNGQDSTTVLTDSSEVALEGPRGAATAASSRSWSSSARAGCQASTRK